MPKAYVLIDLDVTDPERFARYREMSTAAAAQYGGRFLVRGGRSEVLEGDSDPGRTVVLEFDDMEAARRWYGSPEYTVAREVRQAASTGSFLLVEGV